MDFWCQILKCLAVIRVVNLSKLCPKLSSRNTKELPIKLVRKCEKNADRIYAVLFIFA